MDKPLLPTPLPKPGPSTEGQAKPGPSNEGEGKPGPSKEGKGEEGEGENRKKFTFADIARSSLTIEVLSPNEEVPLTNEDCLAIQSWVVLAIQAEPVDGPPRSFEGFVWNGSTYAVRCSDENTFAWAREIIDGIPRLGVLGNPKYRTKSPRDRPPYWVFQAWVPCPGLDIRKVPDLLRRQNPGLRDSGPEDIQVRGAKLKETESGFMIRLEISETLIPEIERLGHRPFIGLSRAILKDPRQGET